MKFFIWIMVIAILASFVVAENRTYSIMPVEPKETIDGGLTSYKIIPITERLIIQQEITLKEDINKLRIVYSGEIKYIEQNNFSKQDITIIQSFNPTFTPTNIDLPNKLINKNQRFPSDKKIVDLSNAVTVEVITGSEYDAKNIKPLPAASVKPSDDSKAAPSTSRLKISFIDFVKKIPTFFKNLFKK